MKLGGEFSGIVQSRNNCNYTLYLNIQVCTIIQVHGINSDQMLILIMNFFNSAISQH